MEMPTEARRARSRGVRQPRNRDPHLNRDQCSGHGAVLLPALTGVRVAQHLDHYGGVTSREILKWTGANLFQNQRNHLVSRTWTLECRVSLGGATTSGIPTTIKR